jgi:hypothetical protein
MKYLSATEILNLVDCNVKEVEVPEWDGAVFVRSMSLKERFVFEEKGNTTDVRMLLLALTLCDKEGNLLFTTDQITQLENKDALVMFRLFQEACKVNGILVNEDLEKKLEKTTA